MAQTDRDTVPKVDPNKVYLVTGETWNRILDELSRKTIDANSVSIPDGEYTTIYTYTPSGSSPG